MAKTKKAVPVMSKRAVLSGDGLVVEMCVEAYHEDVKALERLVRAGLRGAGLKFKRKSRTVVRHKQFSDVELPSLHAAVFTVEVPKGSSLIVEACPQVNSDRYSSAPTTCPSLNVSGHGYDYPVRVGRKYTSADLTRNVEKAVAAAVKFIAEDRAWRDRHNRETEECNARREQMKADLPLKDGWTYDSCDQEMSLTVGTTEIGAKLKAGCDGYEVQLVARGLTVEHVLRLVDAARAL